MTPQPLRAAEAAEATAVPGAAFAVSAVVFVAYFVALHVLVVHDVAPWLAIALVVGPWIVALAATLRSGQDGARSRRALAVGAGAVALGLVAWRFRDRLAGRVDVVLYVENLAFLLALCGLFASTLVSGREPLIARLARRVRGGRLPPEAERYTRRVTMVWAAFFATMALISTLLFATQSRTVWSTFVNLLVWPSMAALFAAEYAVRVRVLRDIPHVPMMRGIDAFRQRHASVATTPSGDA